MRWLKFAAGWLTGMLLLGCGAESFLRLFPPSDLHTYLGEASPLEGIYAADDDFGVTYRCWDDFCRDNAQRLMPAIATSSHDDRPLWALFGNSFVHAPGMLADHARDGVPQRQIFNLGRNEHLCLRMAQIKLLLEHGIRPERIFFVFMPIDAVHVGRQPLHTLRVTSRGALTYAPRRLPGAAGWLVDNSRLALAAQVRLGWQQGNPQFKQRTLYNGCDAQTLADLQILFGNLGKLSQRSQVPITVVLIPAYHQICDGASFGFQDTLAAVVRDAGLDVMDPRAAFAACNDKPSLFLPDKHFAPSGNEILLQALLQHCDATSHLATRSSAEVRR